MFSKHTPILWPPDAKSRLIGRTDAEAETDAKSLLIGKDPDAGKD